MMEIQAPDQVSPESERNLSSEEAQPITTTSDETQPKPSPEDPEGPSPPPLNPNDPLAWSPSRKLTTYLTILLFTFLANVNASNFTIATPVLRTYFRITSSQAINLTALNVLMFGTGNLLWIPLMRITGKRPVYLLAIAVLTAANIWSARAGSYGSLLASRMVSGIGASAADATVPSAVAELWGERERGRMMMCFHISLASGIFLGPLVNSFVILRCGWRWSPGWIAIAGGVVFLLAVGGISETQVDYSERGKDGRERRGFFFWSYLSLTKGIITHDDHRPAIRAAQALQDILIIATYPPILFASALVGIFVGWTIILQISIAQTFSRPPYSWSLSHVGLLHLSGWIGALSALYFGGILIDRLVAKSDKQKKAYTTEPWRRLIALIVPFAIAPTGLVVYGVCLSQHRHWIAPAVGYAMHSFGFVSVSNIVVTYAVDCYKPFSGEAMVVLFLVRNVVAVVCSIYCFPWIEREGVRGVFGTMAGLEWGVMVGLGLPMLFFAGRIQHFTNGYGPMRREGERLEEERKREEEERIGQGDGVDHGRVE